MAFGHGQDKWSSSHMHNMVCIGGLCGGIGANERCLSPKSGLHSNLKMFCATLVSDFGFIPHARTQLHAHAL